MTTQKMIEAIAAEANARNWTRSETLERCAKPAYKALADLGLEPDSEMLKMVLRPTFFAVLQARAKLARDARTAAQ